MDKNLTVIFKNREFLTGMKVGEKLFADLRFANIDSLKSTASQLRASGLGRWEVLQTGEVTRKE